MHRILISGASGFIGKNLVDKLIYENNDLMLIGRNLDMFKTNKIKKYHVFKSD
jgi:short-subunit dehydrogenase